MDYTTLAIVKAALGATASNDDAALTNAITEASRAIDRYCAHKVDAVDYFKIETLTDEQSDAVIDKHGFAHIWPQKPAVSAVTAIEYLTPPNTWTAYVAENFFVNGSEVIVYQVVTCRRPVFVRISYTGGLSADVAGLPADLVSACTTLSIRYYREAETGMNDIVGVAEIGTVRYTQAWPIKVLAMLQPFVRVIA